MKWSNHKHNCGHKGANKWRTNVSTVTMNNALAFDKLKQDIMETGLFVGRQEDGNKAFLCVGSSGDYDGSEIFDGWTDRPYILK